MKQPRDHDAQATRRRFLTGSAGLVAAGSALAFDTSVAAKAEHVAPADGLVEPFWGVHQSGILTPVQNNSYFAAFDVVDGAKRDDLIKMLKSWTLAAARMTRGLPIDPFQQTDAAAAPDTYSTTTVTTTDSDDALQHVTASDSGEAADLSAARLTLTFGFGPGLFVKDDKDRYGLAKLRPAVLVDMPRFAGDQLVDVHTGGDISVQACADNPQVAFHAARQLARLADGIAQIRWTQSGFTPGSRGQRTPRNLMGFKDGTNNPSVRDPNTMAQFVWAGAEGPRWMQDGSYMVARRIRIALEHWDRTKVSFQEQTVGRRKDSGAPLGKAQEFEHADLDAKDKDGNLVIPENAHIRLATAASNAGAQILRRPYSYNDGVNFTAERWPPWRQGMEYDAGLFFVCYQRDPRTGFIRIFENMAKLDMMNQFATHVGGGLFACPPGIRESGFVGQGLFET